MISSNRYEQEYRNNRVERAALSSRSRGQALVIAIMVMFLLAVVAAVFIGIVARNLFRSQRFANVDAVAQLAEAGIRYADKMLTTSEYGADWRPVPENHGVLVDANGNIQMSGGVPAPDPKWQEQRDKFPDFQWTRAYWPEDLGYCGPTGGFTKFDSGGGRFLLRVSYNPDLNDPNSKYIKIESIGRWGVFDENDPTTWRGYGDVSLRREVTAYKPIGLTDYVRFVTNKDNRSAEFPLGWRANRLTFGRSAADSQFGARGGPIRVNGNLAWHGDITVNLRSAHPLLPNGNIDTSRWVPIDAVEVTGRITHGATASVKINRLSLNGASVDTATVAPSDDPNFITVDGFYRDGSDDTDKDGLARGVKRIEAPLVDQADPTGTTTRYRLLTLNSGERIRVGRSYFNLGQYGWGRGIYISNLADKQDESETLIGGYTQQADWLNPNNPMSTYWKGPYYIPPGAVITLNPYDSDGDGQPDLTITRTDTQSNGRKWVWYDAWGRAHPEWGDTITMPYPDAKRGRVIYERNSDGTWNKAIKRDLDGNGVIYAEGNIRIRGMLPPDTQLTIVSNETIYIEGNVLKFRDPAQKIDPKDPYRGTPETGTCGLALLAREHICVNTTQFFAPLMGISPNDIGSDARNGRGPFHVIVSSSPESRFRSGFDFGPWETETAANAPTDWFLLLRHAGDYGPTYINAWLNPSAARPDWGILRLNMVTPALPDYVLGIGDTRFNAPGVGIGTVFCGFVFDLISGNNPGTLYVVPGITNTIQIALDQSSYTRNNYLMGGFAVQPMDIRIEAVLYAQEGSFFVIPGNWFNPNQEDSAPANQANRRNTRRPPGVPDRFPFYGDPLDIRIIIDGAISENIPAAMGAVDEWMTKWSNIPPTYGSSSKPTFHAGEGLTILYDDHAGWPYSDLGTAANPRTPIRADKYGRPLPIAPRLPVSGSLIYFGDVM